MDDLSHKISVLSFTDKTVSYTVDTVLNTCTCMKWKYQRLPIAQRTCKHLDSVRIHTPGIPSITKYPLIHVEDTYFQLVTHHIPDHLDDFVYSVKYDGIRIRITGNKAITRGGITIDLTDMDLQFGDPMIEYDAELIHLTKPGHTNVMLELYANRLNNLSVRVFDVIDTTRTFRERQEQIVGHVPPDLRVQHTPVRDREHLSRVVNEILDTGAEGVVVRHLDGQYEPGRRSRLNIFKVKHRI